MCVCSVNNSAMFLFPLGVDSIFSSDLTVNKTEMLDLFFFSFCSRINNI